MNDLIKVEKSIVMVNNKPARLCCELRTNDSITTYYITSTSSRSMAAKSYFNKFLKSGSKLFVYEVSNNYDQTLLMSFNRNVRGKFTVKNEINCHEEFISVKDITTVYRDLMALFFGKENIEDVKKPLKEVTHNEPVLLDNVNKKQLKGVFYNGKERISKIELYVKNDKPSIDILSDTHGLLTMEKMTISYKKGTREQNTVLLLKNYNINSWKDVLEKFKSGEIDTIQFSYWQKKLRFRMDLFTIEYVNNRFIFSYTLKNEDKNYVTTKFLEVDEEKMSIIDDYDLDVLASVFNIKKEQLSGFLIDLLKSKNKIENKKKFIFSDLKGYHEWAQSEGFTLDYLSSYNQIALEKVMIAVREGFNKMKEEISFKDYDPLYKIAFTKTKNLGMYYHHTSKLEFSIFYNNFDVSTVYHEYGHLIYYSLLNKQLVGEEKAKENNTLIKNFLFKYKNCSYIEVLKSNNSSSLSYYRQDTELFARFFETYMMLKKDKKLYDEKMKKNDTMNSLEETLSFIEFMNKNFKTNFSL